MSTSVASKRDMVTVELNGSTARSVAGVTRNDAVDFVKGSLVLIMILYHWLNYFVTLSWDVYRYLRFLTPSFILITGFLVSHVYLDRYSTDRQRVHRRLIQRGVKLILLFAVLNLLTALTGGRSKGNTPLASWGGLADAMLATGANRAAAFEILLPIGYFLFVAPGVLFVSKGSRSVLVAIATASLLTAVFASMLGFGNSHLELLSVGLVGLAAGAVKHEPADTMLRRPGLLLLAYLCYLAAITMWNVLFPLQVIGVCLSVILIYLVGVRLVTHGALQRRVVELGQYSLFAYITQIGVLQLLNRSFRGADLSGVALLVPFAVCLVTVILAVRLVIVARERSTITNSLYRAVFS